MEQPLTLTARGSDGKDYTFTRPLTLELTRGMDSPAHSLEVSFLRTGAALPPLLTAELFAGGRALFRGYCDQQKEQVSAAGQRLAISARSRGSLLLDNEATPQTYTAVSTRDIFRAHILPYGITYLEVPKILSAGVFQVNKGLSEWEVFCAFCMRMYARVPWVDAQDRVLVQAPDRQSRGVLSNDPARENAVRYLSLTRILRRASVLSEIIIRDKMGSYSSVVSNTQQKDLVIRRRRYIIPAAEYQSTPAADAFSRMQQSRLGFYSLAAVVPGLPELDIGDAVTVEDPLCGKKLLTVYEAVREAGQNGVRTRLTLADPDYL